MEEKAMVLESQLQYSRRNCLIVTGVRETKGENTDEVIKSFAASKLGVTVEDMDIDRTHRLGKPGMKPRPIIVKLTRYNTRLKIMKERRKLKGQKMGIQEHLTPFTQHLLNKANELCETAPWIKKVWTWDGRVTCLMQVEENSPAKKMTVTKVEDLNKLWRKGAELVDTNRAKRTTDSEYGRIEWEKTEKVE
jgi:hypothetical protein